MAKSETYTTQLTLDINTQIYPMSVGEKFQFLLCDNIQDTTITSLDSTNRTNQSGEEGFTQDVLKNIKLKEYDYVMYGIIFKYTQRENNAVVYASFGGLLMQLESEIHTLAMHSFGVDRHLYLLIKKSEI